MPNTVIVAGRRTPCGNLQGVLSSQTAPQLAAVALRDAIADADAHSKTSIAEYIQEVILGCVLPAGIGQAPARQTSRFVGLADSVPATTVNKMCGSGMKTLMLADDAICAGRIALAAAGGMESMSRAPHLLNARQGIRMGDATLSDHMFIDGLRDAYNNELMGVFAQQTADNLNISRKEMDDYATESVRRACAVQQQNIDADEIAPVTIKNRSGEQVIKHDEQPPLSVPEKIPQLRPAFTKDGTVTAANSSCISDGAAVLLLAEESHAQQNGWPILARIIAQSTSRRAAPQEFTIAPADAITKVLAAANWQIGDVNLFEINEAFAVVALAAMQKLDLSHDKVNVRGGACAMGHPVGASGARIVITLLAALRANNLRRGVAAICIGGGEATALAIELV